MDSKVSMSYLISAAHNLRRAHGDIDDLDYELQNTLANIYYKMEILSTGNMISNDIQNMDNDIISSYKKFMYESSHILASYQACDGLISSQREIIKDNPELKEFINQVTIDSLKYGIINAHKKSKIRRNIEKLINGFNKFKRVDEIDGLIDLMKKKAFPLIEKTKTNLKKDDQLKNKESNNSYSYGMPMPAGVREIYEKIDDFISFNKNKNISEVTLQPLEWAIIDISLRNVTHKKGSLHTMSYNDMTIKCYQDKCYCHTLIEGAESKKIFQQIKDYLNSVDNSNIDKIDLDPKVKNYLNYRFNYVFNGSLDLDINPELAQFIIMNL